MSSICLPLAPSVLSTTALFSLTSRSLRPRHRTTTLMLVASPSSASNSRSLRFMPVDEVATDIKDSAGDAAPARSNRGAAETCRVPPCLTGAFRVAGGRRLGRAPARSRVGGAIEVVLRSIAGAVVARRSQKYDRGETDIDETDQEKKKERINPQTNKVSVSVSVSERCAFRGCSLGWLSVEVNATDEGARARQGFSPGRRGVQRKHHHPLL